MKELFTEKKVLYPKERIIHSNECFTFQSQQYCEQKRSIILNRKFNLSK